MGFMDQNFPRELHNTGDIEKIILLENITIYIATTRCLVEPIHIDANEMAAIYENSNEDKNIL